jgi:hypothetical protein
MSTNETIRGLPDFKISHVPQITGFAASVLATMSFPNDGQEIDRFTFAQAICMHWRVHHYEGSIEDDLPVRHRELFAVLGFQKRVSFTDLKLLWTSGTYAGNILKYVFLLDQGTTLQASVRKAVALMVKHSPVSSRTLMSQWAAHRNVSHLWSAYNEYCYGFQRVSAAWRTTAWNTFMDDPGPMLAIANHFRTWGIAHAPKGSKGMKTLDASKAWCIPNAFGKLPELDIFNPNRLYEGLTPETRELLERYRRQ